MPCDRWLGGMTSGLGMFGDRWLGGLASWSGRSDCGWLSCLSRGLGGPYPLGRLRRAAVAAMATVVAALGRSERRCAERRTGEPDECEFHEVVVHSAPSLSVCDLLSWFFEQAYLALTQSKEIAAAVSDRCRETSMQGQRFTQKANSSSCSIVPGRLSPEKRGKYSKNRFALLRQRRHQAALHATAIPPQEKEKISRLEGGRGRGGGGRPFLPSPRRAGARRHAV